MKQVRFQTFGQPSLVAHCVDVPEVGAPAPWEVVVQVLAFPINVADVAMLSGRYGTLPKLPSTIGMEAVGQVTAVGSAVANFQTGDRVVMLGNYNWAEQRKVPAATLYKVPSHLDPLQLSMLKVNPATAYVLLTRFAELVAGDWILQTAALGGVGHCVIQLAKSMGLRTVNVVRQPEGVAQVHKLGGDAACVQGDDLHRSVMSIVGHSPLTLALDAVAGSQVDQLASCLSNDGQVINYGMLSGEPCLLAPERTIFNNITLKGFWLSNILNRITQAERMSLFDAVTAKFADGTLHLPVDSVFPLAGIQDALRRAEQGSRNGRVLVQVGSLN